MKHWYIVNKAADGKPTSLSIMDEIGAYGVSAKNFLNDLKAFDGSTIDLEINSPGGDVFAGLAIYNGLRNSGKTVNVKVLGLAASAASLIAMAGDSIEMPENTFMMIHNPWSFAAGDANEMRATADWLDKIGNSLVATYAKRTGKTEDEIKALLDSETWMTAQEAVDAGFATSVTEATQAKASFDLDRLPENVRAVFALAGEPPSDIDPEQPDGDDEDPSDGTVNNLSDAETLTYADSVVAVAAAFGMDAYAATWALDTKLTSLDAVKARAKEAREIKSLCALAKQPEMADTLIRGAKSLAEARTEIFAALEAGEEHIDTAPRASNSQVQGAQPTAVKTSDIWAARRKQSAK